MGDLIGRNVPGLAASGAKAPVSGSAATHPLCQMLLNRFEKLIDHTFDIGAESLTIPANPSRYAIVIEPQQLNTFLGFSLDSANSSPPQYRWQSFFPIVMTMLDYPMLPQVGLTVTGVVGDRIIVYEIVRT